MPIYVDLYTIIYYSSSNFSTLSLCEGSTFVVVRPEINDSRRFEHLRQLRTARCGAELRSEVIEVY